jgi:hypothetical protein
VRRRSQTGYSWKFVSGLECDGTRVLYGLLEFWCRVLCKHRHTRSTAQLHRTLVFGCVVQLIARYTSTRAQRLDRWVSDACVSDAKNHSRFQSMRCELCCDWLTRTVVRVPIATRHDCRLARSTEQFPPVGCLGFELEFFLRYSQVDFHQHVLYCCDLRAQLG